MLSPRDGVIITLREIYGSVQEIGTTLRGMDERIAMFEERTKLNINWDERSREALILAQESLKITNELKDNLKWLWRAIGTLVISALFSSSFLIYH